MARPSKDAGNRRVVIVRIRVTMAEKIQLQNLARESGYTISDMLRKNAFGAKPLLRKPGPERELLLRFLAELGKQGSNLNQLARQCNRKSEDFEIPLKAIVYTMDEVRALAKQLRETLEDGHKR